MEVSSGQSDPLGDYSGNCDTSTATAVTELPPVVGRLGSVEYPKNHRRPREMPQSRPLTSEPCNRFMAEGC